jgi:hypothetical protein
MPMCRRIRILEPNSKVGIQQPEALARQHRPMRFMPLLAALGMLFLSACTQPSCAEQAPVFAQTLTALFDEWQVAATSAAATPPAPLDAQITAMQDIHRRLLRVQAPDCGRAAKVAFLVAIESTTAELTSRLEQEPVASTAEKQITAARASKRAGDELQKLGIRQKEIPNYLPPLHSNIER